MSTDDAEAGSAGSVSVEDATAAFREFREYARGELDVEHHDVHPIAGLVGDERKRHALEFFATAYDPDEEEVENGLPRDFWETAFAERAKQKYATDTATRAVRDGNITQTAYMTGLPSYKSDVSGLHAINQLADWLVHSEQCKLVYLAALMGRGKTDLSLTMMEVVHDHFRRVERSVGDEISIPTPEFASNFHVEGAGEAEVKEIHRESTLLEWAEEGDSDDERWFIFDEASTELTAQSGANAQNVAENFAPFVKKMRKKGINMIVIGHDKGDVHPAIRSLADFVDKGGLKTASFYAGIKNREPAGHLFDLEGIPPTAWSFDTDDVASWEWDVDGEGDEEPDYDPLKDDEFLEWRNQRIARLYDVTDLSYRDLGNALGVGKDVVGKAVRKYSEENDSGQKAVAVTD